MNGKTVILTPTYNERENILQLIPEIFSAHPDIFVCVIDDSSPDDTAGAVRQLQKKYPHLSLILRPGKQGLGEAYKAGMREVLQDPAVARIITMDADGSHAAEFLAPMLAASETHDIVIGSRYAGGGVENWERWRVLLSRWGNRYARAITQLPVRDMTAGYMSLSADLLRQIDFGRLHASGYAFLMELKYICVRVLGASVAEVPILFKSRREGESKISHHIIREGLKTPWRMRFTSYKLLPAAQRTVPDCPLCGTPAHSFGNKNSYVLYSCPACFLLFVHPIPNNLAQLYGADYFKKDADSHFGYADYDKDKEPMRAVFERYLQKLEGLAPGPRIFDVGAATGYFLDLAKARGCQTFGSEISAYAAAEGAARGHQMFHGMLTELSQAPQVDAVVMWDVLEHVDDPRAYLMAVNRMLPASGVLALSTPDRGSWFARLMGKHWHLIVPPEHLYYYSRGNLTQLLSACGFVLVEFAKPSKKFSLPYIFTMLHSWQGLALWQFFARATDNSFFRFFALPINLRDNMFIIARKV